MIWEIRPKSESESSFLHELQRVTPCSWPALWRSQAVQARLCLRLLTHTAPPALDKGGGGRRRDGH